MPNPQNIEKHKWKKGQSGNPNGRPKKIPALDDLINEVLGDRKNDITLIQAILMKLANKALNGDVNSAKIILEYSYGKPKDNNATNEPINIPPIVINYEPKPGTTEPTN